MTTLLFSYDVEVVGSSRRPFLENIKRIHSDLGIPCTLFICGRVLDLWGSEFTEFYNSVSKDLFDIQQHGYSHNPLTLDSCLRVTMDTPPKTITVKGLESEEASYEIVRTNQLVEVMTGGKCMGLATPFGYYRGLKGSPELLGVLFDLGIRFCRSWVKDKKWHYPNPFEVQPFWYEEEGHPDILEIPSHWWLDCSLRNILGWERIGLYGARVREMLSHNVLKYPMISYVQHDWSSMTYDDQMSETYQILQFAKDLGFEFLSHKAFYKRKLGGKNEL